MKKKLSFKGMWEVVKNSFSGFSDDNVMKLSASLSYYTIFSMAPLLFLIIALCGLFFGKEAVQGQIYAQLQGFMGKDTAAQLNNMVAGAAISGKSTVAITIGIITLILGATSVFAEIQESINMIWGLKPKPKTGWFKLVINRFLSFSVIISLAFIFLVSLGITAILDGFSNHLQAAYPGVKIIIFYIINQILTLIITSTIFAVIFKVLPDAKIKWKDVVAGAIVTALLFMLGKFGISFYISKSNVGSTYGQAGSLIVILLWAYYSAFILYFGAEFTKAYAVKFGSEIHPNDYAVTTQTVEVETGKASVQEKESKDVEGKAQDAVNK